MWPILPWEQCILAAISDMLRSVVARSFLILAIFSGDKGFPCLDCMLNMTAASSNGFNDWLTKYEVRFDNLNLQFLVR
jgi:hypothetical protein